MVVHRLKAQKVGGYVVLVMDVVFVPPDTCALHLGQSKLTLSCFHKRCNSTLLSALTHYHSLFLKNIGMEELQDLGSKYFR